MRPEGYDVIGDVHGMGSELVRLLRHLGYDDTDGHFRHPTRQAVFVGDLIDRGPEQLLTLRTVKAMTDAGAALVAMGNHEFNAIAYATLHPTLPFDWLRERSSKNLRQHEAFLAEVVVDSPLHVEVIEWFRSMPLWLDLGGLRVVHACWDELSMDRLERSPRLTDEVLRKACEKGTPQHAAIEVLLKGPEIPISPPYHDKDGNHRERARFAWWRTEALTLVESVEVPSSVTAHLDGACPGTDGPEWTLENEWAVVESPPVARYGEVAPPVIFGHYWRSGEPSELDAANVACVDWSACKGGPLVAYRWSGESTLEAENYVWADKPVPLAPRHGEPWSADDHRTLLRSWFSHVPVADIADLLGRSVRSIEMQLTNTHHIDVDAPVEVPTPPPVSNREGEDTLSSRFDFDEECRHGISVMACSLCLAAERYGRTVWVTTAGGAFHLRPDCHYLLEGQEFARQKLGADPDAAIMISTGQAQMRNLQPCMGCYST